jgi:putative ABC transport system permease protein
MRVWWHVAWYSAWFSRKRTRAVLWGVGLVSCVLCVMASVVHSAQHNMRHVVAELVSGHVAVQGFYKNHRHDVSLMFPEASSFKEAFKKLPHVIRVTDRLRGWGRFISPSSFHMASVIGIDLNEETSLLRTWGVKREHLVWTPKSVVLCASQAKYLKVGVGDTLSLAVETLQGAVNAVDVQVAAVVEDVGMLHAWNVYTSKELVRSVYQWSKDVSSVLLMYVDNPEKAQDLVPFVLQSLHQKGVQTLLPEQAPYWHKLSRVSAESWTGLRVDVNTWWDELGELAWIFKAFQVLAYVCALCLMGVVSVGLHHMVVSALKRKHHEAGVLRALGMSRLRVWWVVFLEQTMLVVCASCAGCGVAYVLLALTHAVRIPVQNVALKSVLMASVWVFEVSFWDAFAVVCAVTGMACMVAFGPSMRMAFAKPLTLLQPRSS